MLYREIDEKAARAAKNANSFDDYIDGSATEAYRRMVDEAVKLGEWQKSRVDSIHHAKIDEMVDRYAAKLADYVNASNRVDARVPSILIAGGSNFPVAAKQRQNQARDRLHREYEQIQGLLEKIKSIGKGGISSDDPAALEKLQAKLRSLKDLQKIMRDVNAYYRKEKTLDGCPYITDDEIEKLKREMASSWHREPKPFESYLLSNNNANIHRIEKRIEELEARQNGPAPEGWQFDGGEVVMNAEANRLQVMFEDKPDADTRKELRAFGFRWAPSCGAWQRQLTPNAIRAAKLVKAIAPLAEQA